MGSDEYKLHQYHAKLNAKFPVSAQDGIVALGKAHTCSAPSLNSLPNVALKTVPMFVWLNTDRSPPQRVECQPLSFSTPSSFRRSMLWCSGLSILRNFLKLLSTSALPSCRLDMISAVLASLSARSFPLTPACQGSRSLLSNTIHGYVPVRPAYSRLHILQQVHWVCENDGMCNLCIMLGG